MAAKPEANRVDRRSGGRKGWCRPWRKREDEQEDRKNVNTRAQREERTERGIFTDTILRLE